MAPARPEQRRPRQLVCSISPIPTSISPAAAILGPPNLSLKNSVPIAAPTMIEDSRNAAIAAYGLVLWAQTKAPLAPTRPRAANGRTWASSSPRLRQHAYGRRVAPCNAISQPM